MQVLNTKSGPVTIAGVFIIQPGEAREFDADKWAVLRERPSVKFWLERGDLKEVDAPAAQVGTGALSVIDAELGEVVAGAADRHPLDHDGDGKPGGSLPKAKRKPRS